MFGDDRLGPAALQSCTLITTVPPVRLRLGGVVLVADVESDVVGRLRGRNVSCDVGARDGEHVRSRCRVDVGAVRHRADAVCREHAGAIGTVVAAVLRGNVLTRVVRRQVRRRRDRHRRHLPVDLVRERARGDAVREQVAELLAYGVLTAVLWMPGSTCATNEKTDGEPGLSPTPASLALQLTVTSPWYHGAVGGAVHENVGADVSTLTGVLPCAESWFATSRAVYVRVRLAVVRRVHVHVGRRAVHDRWRHREAPVDAYVIDAIPDPSVPSSPARCTVTDPLYQTLSAPSWADVATGLDRGSDRRRLFVDLEDERANGRALVEEVAHVVGRDLRGRRLRAVGHVGLQGEVGVGRTLEADPGIARMAAHRDVRRVPRRRRRHRAVHDGRGRVDADRFRLWRVVLPATSVALNVYVALELTATSVLASPS